MPAKNRPPRPSPPPPARVRSMTGYGRSLLADAMGRVVAEIRSVNNRFLKLFVKLPPGCGALEERIKALLAQRPVVRGSVEVALYFDDLAQEAAEYSIDGNAVRKYLRQARGVAESLNLAPDVPLHALLLLPGAVTRVATQPDPEKTWARCHPLLLSALDQLDAMRLKEGGALAAAAQARLKELRAHCKALHAAAPIARQQAIAKLKERVRKGLREAGVAAPPESAALEREIVLLCDRLDISEELTRLDSHLEQMDSALRVGGAVGRKLDFLTQELLREVNTFGSKAQDISIASRVVEMKGLVEQIREQVQNLE